MFSPQRLSGVVFLAAVSTIAGAISADAGSAPGEDRGVLFGHENVGLDREIITVEGNLGKFTRIRFRVVGHSVHVHDLKIVYGDGTDQIFPIDADIAADARSDWLAVKGDRFIRAIELTHRPDPVPVGEARIEVTGQYVPGWLDAGGEGRQYHGGWVLLGAQSAGFTGYDRDVINVGENEGGFARLRIEALDRAITLREIRVKYASGSDEVFRMRVRIDPGKPYGPLEFKGGSAPIKAIEARYRSRFDFGKGLKSVLKGKPAVVQIWGQH